MVEGHVGSERIRVVTEKPVSAEGDYVLYWMTAARRLRWNFALDRAVDWCRELGRPLVVLEGIRSGYRWASSRLHRFALDGMKEKAEGPLPPAVRYLAYVEPEDGAGSGLLEAMAAHACVVVGDDYPAFFLPRMIESAGRRMPVRFEVVDGNGLLPMQVADRAFTAAYHFRRFLQRTLPEHLGDLPEASGLTRLPAASPASVRSEILERWPMRSASDLGGVEILGSIPVDQSVGPVDVPGGEAPAREALDAFVADGLRRYETDRNHPDRQATSHLSPYLHWGHLSAHEVFAAVSGAEGWTPLRLGHDTSGARQGWWGMTPAAEAFLDQLVTWRELGFNTASRVPGFDTYDSLPEWARRTLADHEADPREWVYDLEAFDRAETHDELWNAAQRELRETGQLHNYLRMLWGKKILEWSEDPRSALEIMIELNNRYALDGRDPNSYSGIFWILGRYDRGWPERAVYGKVRSMSSDRTRRKVELTEYLRRFSGE